MVPCDISVKLSTPYSFFFMYVSHSCHFLGMFFFYICLYFCVGMNRRIVLLEVSEVSICPRVRVRGALKLNCPDNLPEISKWFMVSTKTMTWSEFLVMRSSGSWILKVNIIM